MTSSHPQGLGFNKPVWEALECLKAPRVYSNEQAESRTGALGWEVSNLSPHQNHPEGLSDRNWEGGAVLRVSDSVGL